MKRAFLKDEKEAFEHLGKAVAAFQRLVPTHPSHVKDFTDGIHKCQQILGQRLLQREQPYIFATYIKISDRWIPLDSSRVDTESQSLDIGPWNEKNPHYKGEIE